MIKQVHALARTNRVCAGLEQVFNRNWDETRTHDGATVHEAAVHCTSTSSWRSVAGAGGFCPSSGARRMSQTAAHLVDHVIQAAYRPSRESCVRGSDRAAVDKRFRLSSPVSGTYDPCQFTDFAKHHEDRIAPPDQSDTQCGP